MVAEPWILKMGNQVSNNLKHALFLDQSKKNNTKKPEQKEIIGILSFEVANVMSKTVHLHKSLTDLEISRLKSEILKSEGVRNLVSSDESYLLELALAEKLDDLNRVAAIVSRLGKKCSEPALQGFEHVYSDILTGVIDVKELGFLVKDMEGMIRKMERYVTSTCNLYNEMEVLNELEQATKKFQQNQHEESRRAFEHKVTWQRQDVKHLKDISLWNQTYDKVVGLLARTICTIYARVCIVFEDSISRLDSPGLSVLGVENSNGGEGFSQYQEERRQISGQIDRLRKPRMSSELLQPASSKIGTYNSDRRRRVVQSGLTSQKSEGDSFHPEDFSFPCGSSPGRLFLECLSLSSSASKLDDVVEMEDHNGKTLGSTGIMNEMKSENRFPSGSSSRADLGVPFSGGDQRQLKCNMTNRSRIALNSRVILHAPPSTIGGSALALHYANVIIIIEKLLRYPHLVGEEARDDLYQMLPTSLRMSLRTNLKSYVKNLAIYDAPLAHDWKEILDKILRWLAPLAHNMIRWQTERNFEQQQIITRTNVLLLQTLYFADREKTEEAICELLVGLNYICRYEHQQNALLDCASSFDFDDGMAWESQY